MTHKDLTHLTERLLPLSHEEGLRALLTGGADAPAIEAALAASAEGRALLAEGLTEERIALMRLCAQCSGTELLSALMRCPFAPSPSALAAVIETQRREDAMRLYELQLLWRITGETELPDALTLFRRKEERA